jgi:hypothetical protein
MPESRNLRTTHHIDRDKLTGLIGDDMIYTLKNSYNNQSINEFDARNPLAAIKHAEKLAVEAISSISEDQIESVWQYTRYTLSGPELAAEDLKADITVSSSVFINGSEFGFNPNVKTEIVRWTKEDQQDELSPTRSEEK